MSGRAELPGFFAAHSPGSLLDIPAGTGRESAALRALGYRVYSIDLFAGSRASGAELKWIAADATQRFPFRDQSFDYVLSREGIEHFEDQASFVRECARVLKPDGKIVVTTPNMLHLSARLSYLLTGQRSVGRGLANEVQTLRGINAGRIYHGHIFMVDYFRMRYMMRLAGFRLLAVSTDRYSPTSFLLAPMAPILYGMSRWSAYRAKRTAIAKKRRETPPAVIREILHHVFSPALLFGKRMIVIAEKEAAP